ncbi:MAG: beta-lactamase family protein [Candidatus Eisenbacteria bacterium]|nr:beta-lactamase family protein [Candidatus Eisenbacteria bacterium]
MRRCHLLPMVLSLPVIVSIAALATRGTNAASSHAVSASHSTTASDARLVRTIDAYVKPMVDRGDLSGQLLVARNGTIVLERCYGFANRELGIPVTPESRFNIASVTKPMTTVLAIKLMEQKSIGYHDSIARWIPDFPKGDSIRVEQLLRHRSGIPHELVPDTLATRPRTAAEMVEIAKHEPLDFPPGSRSSYSSGGFTVLARILEIASGMDYPSLIERAIFMPLGMTHSRSANGIELLPNRVSVYMKGSHGIDNAPYQDFSGIVGAGSVWSTARDLHRFVQAIVTGALGASARQSLVRDRVLDFNGRTSGFTAFAEWDSTTGVEVIFAGNLLTGATEAIRHGIPPRCVGTRASSCSRTAYASCCRCETACCGRTDGSSSPRRTARSFRPATTESCAACRAPTVASRGSTGPRTGRCIPRRG